MPRKAFNFYRSYFTIMEELPEKDQLPFIKAILEKQFYGTEPNLTGMAKFAYTSQKHSIDSQVKGFEDKTGEKLCKPNEINPTQGGAEGGTVDPSVQEKEKEKEKVQRFFDIFWEKYPNKIGKKDCLKIWLKLKPEDINTILDTIDNFIKHKPFESYTHPNPKTYLNQERWNDVIETPQEAKMVDPLVEYVKQQQKIYDNGNS